MKNVYRQDFVFSKIKKLDKYTDENGFALLEATPTRVGVLKYKTEDGKTIRELRHPDDVFAKESMDTLAMKPFTLEHRGGFVTPETAEIQIKGSTGESIESSGDHLKCKIAVYSKEALDSISEDEMVELSAGYNCDTIPEQGVFKGQPYDMRQTNIRYNHVTATKRGRAGSTCRLRLDSEGSSYIEREGENKQKEDAMPEKLKFDGYKSDEFNLDAVEVEKNDGTEKLMDMLGSALKKIDGYKGMSKKTDSSVDEAKMDSMAIMIKSLKKDVSTLKDENASLISTEKMDSLIGDRLDLIEIYASKGEELPEGKTFEEVNSKAILATLKGEGLKSDRLDSDDSYRSASWDIIRESKDLITRNAKSKQNLDKFSFDTDYSKGVKFKDTDNKKTLM